MKKNILILICTALAALNTRAQNFEWAKQLGGINNDLGYSIATDAAGNVYTTGYFTGTADFDPSPSMYNLTSFGSVDIFISKLDVFGNFVWAIQMGGMGDEGGYSITVDASGNVYITGSFQGTVDFDPSLGTFNLTSVWGDDIFISKLNAAGNFVWAKQIGGLGTGYGESITIDTSGNVIITGSFTGTSDFDPAPSTFYLTSEGNNDIFISKLDAAGNFVWAKKIGGTSYDKGQSITTDFSGNVYTTGSFQGTVDFDPGSGIFNLVSLGDNDIFISKLDASGNFVWAKQIGGTSGDVGNSISTDASGGVYTTGYFNGTVDFDPGPGTFNLTSAGNEDIFISKLDGAGNFIWAKKIGSTNVDYSFSLSNDILGNVYTTGYFNGTVDFDPGPGTFNLASAGNEDIFISKLDAAGNFVWAIQMGGGNSEVARSITVDTSGNVYTTGSFVGTVDFDQGQGTFNLTSASTDIFVHKMSQWPASVESNIFPNIIQVFPNPSKGNFSIDLGSPKNTIEVIITDILGREVMKNNFLNAQLVNITLEGEGGIYFLHIFSDNKQAVLKVLKE